MSRLILRGPVRQEKWAGGPQRCFRGPPTPPDQRQPYGSRGAKTEGEAALLRAGITPKLHATYPLSHVENDVVQFGCPDNAHPWAETASNLCRWS